MARLEHGPSDYEILATKKSWENADKTSQPVPHRHRTRKATEDGGLGAGGWADERGKESNTVICLIYHQQFSKGYQMKVSKKERQILIRHVNVLTTQFDQF